MDIDFTLLYVGLVTAVAFGILRAGQLLAGAVRGRFRRMRL
jgi:hypothetical protein